MSKKILERLPNGAELVALTMGIEGHGIVMAKVREDEYATWQFSQRDLANTYWGHYFTDPETGAADAYIDYLERAKKLIDSEGNSLYEASKHEQEAAS